MAAPDAMSHDAMEMNASAHELHAADACPIAPMDGAECGTGAACPFAGCPGLYSGCRILVTVVRDAVPEFATVHFVSHAVPPLLEPPTTRT